MKKRPRGRFNLSLDADNYKKLKEIATLEQINYSDILDALIEDFLRRYKK